MPRLKRSPTASTRSHKVCNSRLMRSPPQRMAPDHRTRGNNRARDNNRDKDSNKDRGNNRARKAMVARAIKEGREITLATNRGKTNQSLYQGRLAPEPARRAMMAATASFRTEAPYHILKSSRSTTRWHTMPLITARYHPR